MVTTRRIVPAGLTAPQVVGSPTYDGPADQVVVLAARTSEFHKRQNVTTDTGDLTLLVAPNALRREALVVPDPINLATDGTDVLWVGTNVDEPGSFMPVIPGTQLVHAAAAALYGYVTLGTSSTADVYVLDELH